MDVFTLMIGVGLIACVTYPLIGFAIYILFLGSLGRRG